SFAFRYGNNFIVNQQGQLVANFGALKPPGSPEAGLPGLYDPLTGSSPIVGAGRFKLPGLNSDGNAFDNQLFPPTTATPFTNPNYPLRPGFGAYNNPGQPGVTTVTPGTPPQETVQVINGAIVRTTTPGTPDTFQYELPSAFQYPRNQFFDFVKAVIESRTTKILASPTLILSENAEELNSDQAGVVTPPTTNFLGNSSTNQFIPQIGRSRANESAVVVGEQVTVNYKVQAGQNGAPNTCEPQLGIAGLTFGARVAKIDDNGFVTFSLSPAISAVVDRQTVAGCAGFRDILSVRSLDTGNARVRDGQTLILTGVLSDRDLDAVSKWPILGDLPIVGQFFRKSVGNREKRELVVMVTPRIINDTEGGTYGYGFEPSTRDTQQFMNASPSSSMPNYYQQR
ncbi:MAG: type II secretion system protein GspD, partial [Cyanobium sp.]